MGMYWVYVLENSRKWHYIGYSADLAKRIRRHNHNSVRSTKNKGPFKIVYQERFATKTEARKRENELKRRKSSKVLDTLIADSVPIV